VALVRGPLVYCFEEADNGEASSDLLLADASPLKTAHSPDFPGGPTVIEAAGMTAIPYYAWSQREPGRMAVWVRRETI
jgi:DUF1680 family protein